MTLKTNENKWEKKNESKSWFIEKLIRIGKSVSWIITEKREKT